MSPISHRFCLKVTEKIMRLPIASAFCLPVDPQRDNCPDYFDKIKKPMDLSLVHKKLTENQYPSVDRWKEDMNLIWKNATLYNSDRSFLYGVAKELNDFLKRKCENIPTTETQLWHYKVGRAHAQLVKLLDAKPDPTKKLILGSSNVPKPARPTKITLRSSHPT
jgi:hypothetical protein